jgi:sn-glycerol 3-phosphate transport system substrate-binding protein
MAAGLGEGEPRRQDPIYTGTYQDSITKALTAVKRRAAGDVDPAVDRHNTLIDEDAIAVRRPDQDDDDRSVSFTGVRGEQPDRRQDLGILLQRSTIVLYCQQGALQEADSIPTARRRTGASRSSMQAHQRDASGNVTVGDQIPSSGFPYRLFQALAVRRAPT